VAFPAAAVHISTPGLSRAGTLHPNHPGSDTLGFQTSRYILRVRSNPNLWFDATVWAYRRFYALGICKFSMLAVIRRNAILPECHFSRALLNTFLEQLKEASQTGNIPTERAFASTKRALILYDRCVR